MSNKSLILFKNFPETKKESNLFVSKVVDLITGGECNPIEIELKLKMFENVISEMRKNENVKSAVSSEVDKYSEKTINIFNAKITKSGKTTYKFETCNDSVYDNLKIKLKERETFLKSLKQEVVNNETGEIIKPPINNYSSFLKIEFI